MTTATAKDYEPCSDRIAPLRKILEWMNFTEWLECGHTISPRRDWFGRICKTNRRRCEKCRIAAKQDFDPKLMFDGRPKLGDSSSAYSPFDDTQEYHESFA